MMILFKIIEYYPDEQSISVRFCNAKSKKPIDDYKAVAIDCKNLRMENFVRGYTYHLKIEFQFYPLDLIDLHIN